MKCPCEKAKQFKKAVEFNNKVLFEYYMDVFSRRNPDKPD